MRMGMGMGIGMGMGTGMGMGSWLRIILKIFNQKTIFCYKILIITSALQKLNHIFWMGMGIEMGMGMEMCTKVKCFCIKVIAWGAQGLMNCDESQWTSMERWWGP